MLSRPEFVKDIKLCIEFEDTGKYEGGTIHMGIVRAYIETESECACKDYWGCSESYGKDKTKEEAVETIISDMLCMVENMLDEDEIKDFWKYFIINKS